MSRNAHEHPHEIIIVKHGGGDHDEGHHGGVWKIAFADFMTAMMCFFLVMWLINAANEQTKAAVASYFNPVKLIDRNSSRKGLEDVGDGPNSLGSQSDTPQPPDAKAGVEGRAEAGPEDVRSSQDAKKSKDYSDEHLFADPYAVLAEIAGDTGTRQNISEKGDGGAQNAGPASGASGGESYRDPFAPDFWTKQVQSPIDTEPSIEAPAVETRIAADETEQPAPPKDEAEPVERVTVTPPPATSAEPQHPAGEQAVAEEQPKDQQPTDETGQKPEQPAKSDMKPEAKEAPAQEAEAEPKDQEPTAKAVAKAMEIKRDLARAMGTGDKLGNGLEVIATDKGVTISVTDKFDFGMFEIGSAVPRKQLVLAMEKISKVLAGERGSIIINGHTDARPFKGANYDNWRLSSARAQSAYYMLVRAGLDEQRVKEVAGFADRQLKLQDKPLDAANRRIEILLEVQG
jgi:chemotaxis protein MotB